MKKVNRLFTILGASILLLSTAACSGESSGPRKVFEKISAAMCSGNLEEVEKYSSPQMLIVLGFANVETFKSQAQQRANCDYTILKDSIVGDKAWIYYYMDGDKENKGCAEFIKMDDKWYFNGEE